ncbi:hypothetical protein PVA38_10900 [Streptococcus pneumoniae D39]|nr:hypothetical protein PVA38_10900 [Streptococcus pneumoniae D39]
MEVQEEKVAFHRQGHENTEMLVGEQRVIIQGRDCLLYTSDAADEARSVDLGLCRIIKKKNNKRQKHRSTIIST